jgi:peptidoglycan/xylan/chitin deacetylase (PgdA/CDA1 family)
MLRKYNAKASFFLIGENIEKYPDLVKEINAEGHTIGLHTFSHNNLFPFFSVKRIKRELIKNNEIIYRCLGYKTILFRPPFGVTNPQIAKAVKALNLKVVGWNRRSLDTISKNSKKVSKKITGKLKPGDIVLLHDYSDICLEVLEKVLEYAKSQNLKAETLSEFFETEKNWVSELTK